MTKAAEARLQREAISCSKARVVGSSRNTSSERVVVIVAASMRRDGVVLTSPEEIELVEDLCKK